ncbi:hypothetical protein NECAME_15071 [Necator americanus]|uniref:Uncharacterized protein n=1 Tax=Necator americanus TaxID=51031 RepID=W2SM86_NECAM|nr:hypothetical protein NECAME_15071 [Necator americanus]ETN69822.1 hypothetical protein NECAME_15071 [Necator americanus]
MQRNSEQQWLSRLQRNHFSETGGKNVLIPVVPSLIGDVGNSQRMRPGEGCWKQPRVEGPISVNGERIDEVGPLKFFHYKFFA